MLTQKLPAVAAMLILSGAAWAQTDVAPKLPAGLSPEMAAGLPADGLIGMTVLTTDGAVVGDVTDLILDQEDHLRGIVVSVDGVRGLDGRAVGVSWSQAVVRADPETNDRVVVLNLTRADIAPVQANGGVKAEQAAVTGARIDESASSEEMR